jgi:hypothetical protein
MSSFTRVLRSVGRRRRLRRLALGIGFIYLALFLFAIGDLNVYPDGFGLSDFYIVPGAGELLFERRSAFYFEAVAIASSAYVTWLIAPLNILLGTLLAALVGVNAAFGYLAWRQPRACGVGSGSGVLAAIPGLLAGSACCAPTLLLVLGLPASASLLSLFSVMVPIALLLLIASLLLIGRRLDPAFAAEA